MLVYTNHQVLCLNILLLSRSFSLSLYFVGKPFVQLLTAGILGLILLRYQLPKRHKIREHCFVFLRINSYIVSVLALFLCLLALIFVSLHYTRLTASNTRCQSSNILMIQGSCLCTFNLPLHSHENSSIISTGNSIADDESYQFEYR